MVNKSSTIPPGVETVWQLQTCKFDLVCLKAVESAGREGEAPADRITAASQGGFMHATDARPCPFAHPKHTCRGQQVDSSRPFPNTADNRV
jgi:hypothetical protein